MKPGPKLDALVAEKVMGLEPWPEQDPRWECTAFKARIARIVLGCQEAKPCLPPEYSTDIKAAWSVVEHFAAKKPSLHIELEHYSEGWTASFLSFDPNEEFAAWRSISRCDGETAMHAICRAALAVVSVAV